MLASNNSDTHLPYHYNRYIDINKQSEWKKLLGKKIKVQNYILNPVSLYVFIPLRCERFLILETDNTKVQKWQFSMDAYCPLLTMWRGKYVFSLPPYQALTFGMLCAVRNPRMLAKTHTLAHTHTHTHTPGAQRNAAKQSTKCGCFLLFSSFCLKCTRALFEGPQCTVPTVFWLHVNYTLFVAREMCPSVRHYSLLCVCVFASGPCPLLCIHGPPMGEPTPFTVDFIPSVFNRSHCAQYCKKITHR